MTLRNKLAFSFLAIGILFAVQVVITLQSNTNLAGLVEEAVDKNQMAVGDLNEFAMELQKLRRYEKEYFIYIADAIKKRHYEFEWNSSLQAASDMLTRMRSNQSQLFTAGDLGAFAGWQEALEYYAAEFAKIVAHYDDLRLFGEKAELARATHSVEANSMIADGKKRVAEVIQAAIQLGESRSSQSHRVIEDIETTFERVKWTSLGVAVLAWLIAVVLIMAIPGSLSRGLATITRSAEMMGDNDYSRPVGETGIRELDRLSQALEKIRLGRFKK